MDELVRWLGEQLDEDERIARAACWDDQSDVWTASPPRARYEQYTVVDYLDDGVVVVTPENADADGVGQHVAEWDPARALRAIETKRQMLRDADDFCAEYDAEIDDDNSAAQRAYCWRDTIRRNLAAEYAHRPGYLAEWAPTD